MKLYEMRPGVIADGLRDMMQVVDATPPFVMAELGSFAGESAEIFLEFNITKLYCVDRWEDRPYNYTPITARPDLAEEVFDAKLKDWHAQGRNVVKIKSETVDAARFVENLDLLYIDAAHTIEGVAADIDAWLPFIRKSGWIAGHDWNWNSIRMAVMSRLGHLGEPQIFRDNSWLLHI